MMNRNLLQEAYIRTTYPVAGHGKRNLQNLMDALETIDGQIESDVYGKGKVIEEFQEKIAKHLGKESAVFFPSGTMAQQIALRIWCDEKNMSKVAYHPLCHLEIHEQEGLKVLHKIEPLLIADADRLIQLADVTGINEDIACLLLELPQREIGGQLPDFQTLEAISIYCREQGIRLHLDGARLFEALPYYQKSAAEICALFDSVYVSFYKGIGGIAGAVLAGSPGFTEKSKIWKRRHGGDLISLYPYIVSANDAFDQRIHKMTQYFEGAKDLAGRLNQCSSVMTQPIYPVSNMFHLYFDKSKEVMESILIDIYEVTGIGITGNLMEKDGKSRCEIWIGDRYADIPKDRLDAAIGMLQEKLKDINVLDEGPFYHGTKADLKLGDLLEVGFSSNYGKGKKANFVYLTATLNAAIWGAELAAGVGPGRIYLVEPLGFFENDPNLTDKKFPGNPTRSYRSQQALKVVGEVTDWEGHTPEELKKMTDHLDALKQLGIDAIND